MSDVLLISKAKSEQKSLDFSFLREKGVENIQALASKIWTDFNAHDPGVTILEQLVYAITELGYRTNFDIKDILAQDPNSNHLVKSGIYTAPQIFTSAPVTQDDYKKILLDIDGIRNAFVTIASGPEIPVYIDTKTGTADYKGDDLIDITGLYSVILELDNDEQFGDLNSNILNWSFRNTQDPSGHFLETQVSFPNWLKVPFVFRKSIYSSEDTSSANYPKIVSITLEDDNLFALPEKRTYATTLNVTLAIKDSEADTDTEDSEADTITYQVVKLPVNIVIEEDVAMYNSGTLQEDLKDSLKGENESTIEQLILNYNKKLVRIWEIVETAQTRLNSYRNLCEDFIELKNIEVEEVGLCLQIEVGPGADINAIEAEIYHRIASFLSPRIKFHSAAELLNKGMTVDQLFEGPLLEHGFLDLSEFLTIDERKILYVSDLIQILMNIPGVVSVADIHLNSYIDNLLMNESVTDCLAPTFSETHRLRLSIEKSSTIYFRDDDPLDPDKVLMIANKRKVQEKIKELQILENKLMFGSDLAEFDEPTGTYRNLQEYYSIQNNFPLSYGVGPAGIDSEDDLRIAQVKQLKSYLLFSEQLMANFLAQLAHIKELFAIDKNLKRTYFSQLIDIPNPFGGDYEPYVSSEEFPYKLQDIIEGNDKYIDRRNRVLDHLLARFSEDFSNYAFKMFEVFGSGTEERVINDKLNFLNNLPVVSGDRFRAFNYRDKANVWNTENVSGYQKRISLQLGISDFRRKSLYFNYDERIDDVNKIFRLYEKVDGHLPVNPSSASSQGPGEVAWTGFAGITTDSESSEVESGILSGEQLSEYLFVKGFDFSFIPSDKSILGIKVEIVKRRDDKTGLKSGGDIEDYEIKLLKDGVVVGENKARVGEAWQKDRAFFTYGGPSDKWNVEWTDADIKDSDFGVAIKVKKTGEKERIAKIDNVKITVFYTDADIKYHFECQPSNKDFGVSGIAAGYSTEQERKDVITDLATYGYNLCNYCIDGITSYSIRKVNTAEDKEDKCPETLTVLSFDTSDKKITVVGNYVGKISSTSLVTIYDTSDAEFENTVSSITYTSLNTEIVFANSLTSGLNPVSLKYENVPGVNVVYTGNATSVLQAATDFSDLIFNTFWNLEGMHVVEHILLRPKVNEKSFVALASNKIKTQDIGTVRYQKYIDKADFQIDFDTNLLIIEGDLTSEIHVGNTINLVDKYYNATVYSVQTIEYDLDTSKTKIKCFENYSDDQPLLYLSYERQFHVSSFDTATNSVRIGNPDLESEIHAIIDYSNSPNGFVFEVFNSQYNAGTYRIQSTDNVTAVDSETLLNIEDTLQLFVDDLLPVSLTEDECVCPELKDNYSFRLSVIMPGWPARFTNSAFRKMAERTIRMEAPAHVQVRLVWVTKEQMKNFEPAYKNWLTKIANPVVDESDNDSIEIYKQELNNAHDVLVQKLFALRNQKAGTTIGDISDNDGTTSELSLIGQIYLG